VGVWRREVVVAGRRVAVVNRIRRTSRTRISAASRAGFVVVVVVRHAWMQVCGGGWIFLLVELLALESRRLLS
jgi:hypothetical protein